MSSFVPQGMGWRPDLPDARDYTFRHPKVLSLLRRLKRARRKTLPAEVDLRHDSEGQYFTEPEDQRLLHSSSSFAVLSLCEYFERRIRGQTFEGSKLFLYKVACNCAAKRSRRQHRGEFCENSHSVGDAGADLRTTLKALVQFGVPPEEYWPYEIDRFDEEPSAFLYGLSKSFRGVCYFRLDEPNTEGETTWATVKSFLAAGFPIAFGFPVPASLTAAADIPYRPKRDGPRGGQAVVAVGYRTNHFGRGQDALRIRSSWGSQWGDNGNGWLPVAFVRRQLARDFWSMASEEWLDSSELSQPSVISAVS